PAPASPRAPAEPCAPASPCAPALAARSPMAPARPARARTKHSAAPRDTRSSRRHLGVALAVEVPHDEGDLAAHLEAARDAVEHAVLEQELAPLEALRELLADGRLDDARTGEADERVGLGDVH